MKFVVIPELRGRWVWELKDDDGCVLSRSTLSYGDRDQALRVIQTLRRSVVKAQIFDPLGRPFDELMQPAPLRHSSR